MLARVPALIALMLPLALGCSEQGGSLLERKHVQEAEQLAEQLGDAKLTPAVAEAKKTGQRGWQELTFPVQTAKITCPDRTFEVRYDPYYDSLRFTVAKTHALDEKLRSVIVGETYVFAEAKPFEGPKKIEHDEAGDVKPSYTIEKLTSTYPKLFAPDSRVEVPVVVETMAAVKKDKDKFHWVAYKHEGYRLTFHVFSEEMRSRIKAHKIEAELMAAELHVLERLLGKRAEALRGVDQPKVKQVLEQYDARLKSAEDRKKELAELPFAEHKDALKVTVDPPCDQNVKPPASG